MKPDIFCINLDRRPDRWESMQKRFKNQNLQAYRWSAIDYKQYNFGRKINPNPSHMTLLYFCSIIGIEYALIFEDDVVLCNNFMQKLIHIVEEMPSDWDALSLHCFKAKTTKITNNLCRLLSPTYGNHGILLNKIGINKVLNNNNKYCIEDMYFKSLNNFYAVNPENTMAFQTGEDSDIPETSIINEYKNFYEKYKHLYS